MLISLSQLSHPLAVSARAKEIKEEEKVTVEFSDEAPSDESSNKSSDGESSSDEEDH